MFLKNTSRDQLLQKAYSLLRCLTIPPLAPTLWSVVSPKGVFELKPSLPKYKNIWDVNTVLTYLSSLHPPQDLTLKDLTYKNYNAFSIVVWAEMPDNAFAICQLYGIAA